MRFSTYVGVIVGDSIKFVTGVDRKREEIICKPRKEAQKFSEDSAKEIVEGLTFNGIYGCIVRVPSCVTVKNEE